MAADQITTTEKLSEVPRRTWLTLKRDRVEGQVISFTFRLLAMYYSTCTGISLVLFYLLSGICGIL